MASLFWTFSNDPSDEDVAELRGRLAAWNASASGIAGERWLACFVRGSDGELLGGTVGRAWGEVLELRLLWVHETLRSGGIGSQLLQRIETEAYELGCKTVITDTFSFQAPEFYSRHGFEVFGTIKGYPESTAKYYLRKTIQPVIPASAGIKRS